MSAGFPDTGFQGTAMPHHNVSTLSQAHNGHYDYVDEKSELEKPAGTPEFEEQDVAIVDPYIHHCSSLA